MVSPLDTHHYLGLPFLVLLQLLAAGVVEVSTSDHLLLSVATVGLTCFELNQPLNAQLAVVILEYFKGLQDLISRAEGHLPPGLDSADETAFEVEKVVEEGLFFFTY